MELSFLVKVEVEEDDTFDVEEEVVEQIEAALSQAELDMVSIDIEDDEGESVSLSLNVESWDASLAS